MVTRASRDGLSTRGSGATAFATSIRPSRKNRTTKRGACFNRPRSRDGDGPSATRGDADDGDDDG